METLKGRQVTEILFHMATAIMLAITLGPSNSDPRAGILWILTFGAIDFVTVDLLVAQKVTRLIVKIDVGVNFNFLIRLHVLTIGVH